MRTILQKLRPLLLPRNSSREKFARLLLRRWAALRQGFSASYQGWIRLNEPALAALASPENLPTTAPIAILLLLDNPRPASLKITLTSILQQTEPGWQLHIFASPADQATCQTLVQPDPRIIYHLHGGPISASLLNTTLRQLQTDLVTFLRQDACLAPFALASCQLQMQQFPQADMFYADHDRLDPKTGRRFDPFFKPAFDIDYLQQCDFFEPFWGIRAQPAETLGWFNQQLHSAHALDLLLRLAEASGHFLHIPQVCSHLLTGSRDHCLPPIDPSPWASQRVQVLSSHLQRQGWHARPVRDPSTGLTRFELDLHAQPLISIIIPNHEHPADLRTCVESILARSTYQNYEIIIMENNSTSAAIFELYQQLQTLDARVRLFSHNHLPFNYSEINNVGAAHAAGEYLLFLNNDTRVYNSDWIERLLDFAIRPHVGVVGAKLYYPNMLIQHAGLILGLGVGAGHHQVGCSAGESGYHGNLISPHRASAVTAACLMIRTEIFHQVGGFDLFYQLGYGDVDLCLKVWAKHYAVLWSPYAGLIHDESLTRGYEDNPAKQARFFQEADQFMRTWSVNLADGDPWYNPNLALDSIHFAVRTEKCKQAARLVSALPPALPS